MKYQRNRLAMQWNATPSVQMSNNKNSSDNFAQLFVTTEDKQATARRDAVDSANTEDATTLNDRKKSISAIFSTFLIK